MDAPANAAGASEPPLILLPPSAALPQPRRWVRRAMAVMWPAFLLACVVQLLVFALVDPVDFHWDGGALNWSRQAIYAAAFFAFWLLAILSSALTVLLVMPAVELNTGAQASGRNESAPLDE
ncbi:MAG TPA: hypothetical protein VES36_10700 [Candidatus Limnocylindrales bacterium]|nr:hypothetical protein [Candidatus Limnocylindrales bacterium]